MVEPGEYLLSQVGFSLDDSARIVLQRQNEFIEYQPLGQTFTIKFDISQRFCRGWHNLETGIDSPCPDGQVLEGKYDQCAACQKRTGFNPAFYHAASVSPQQEHRNQQPHFLYLAYFADDTVKVGISYAQRGKARLLEQGARSALVLDTFPTAHIARHYEERIAKLPGICETLQLAKKIALLKQPHSAETATDRLQTIRRKIEESIQVSFTQNDTQHLDRFYFPSAQLQLDNAYNCAPDHTISGKATGMLGSLLFCNHQDTSVFLSLKKYIGYKATISLTETPLHLPAQQTSLF